MVKHPEIKIIKLKNKFEESLEFQIILSQIILTTI